jgi:hypothetical protein
MCHDAFSPHRSAGLLGTLLLLLLLGSCSKSETVAVAADKPSSPLQVSLRPLEEATPGKIVTFEAEVSAYAPFADVVLAIDLPAPLRLVAGPQRWQGALVPGEPQRITFTVYLPTEGRHKLRVTATVQGGNGRLANEAHYLVGEDDNAPLGGIRQAPREAPPSGDGRPVLEYPVR